MSGLGVAMSAIALLAQLRTDFGVLLRAESAAGLAPIAPGERAERALALTLEATPNLQVDGNRSTFRIAAGSRLYYRQPHLGDLERPLILGNLALMHRYAIDRRTRWLTDAGGTAGEVDYANTQLALTPGTGSQLNVPVLNSLRFQAITGIERSVARNHLVRFDAVVEHSESLGAQVGLLPTTTAAGGGVAWQWLLSTRTTLRFPVQGRYYFAEPGYDLVSTSMGIVVLRELDRRSTLEIATGVMRVDVFATGQSTYPRALVAWRQSLVTRQRMEVSSSLGGGLDALYDVTRAAIVPIATVQSSLTATWSQKWAARMSVSGYTQLGPVPPPEYAGTSFSADAVLDRRLTEVVDVVAGARYFTRASDLRAEHFRVIDRQGWLFLGLRVNLETYAARRGPQVF